MALVVEDGTIVDGANSYATAQDAMNYFMEHGEELIITDGDMLNAASFLDKTYGPHYKGCILSANEQSMLFPRTTFIDNNGRTVQANTIPYSLIESQYQAAKLNANGTILIGNTDPQSQLESYTKTVVGAVSKSEKFFAPVNRKETTYISNYIYPIIDTTGANGYGNSMSGRTVRA
jgi:hypothetical protein